jgi:hypothetical protein
MTRQDFCQVDQATWSVRAQNRVSSAARPCRLGSPARRSEEMTQTSAGIGPIPPARKDDSEDVAWALSTAEAMHARGDRGDALKWLRRAAEAASEAQSDDRALELAKAAADLASVLGPTTNAPPPRPPLRPTTSVFPVTRSSVPSPAPASAYPGTPASSPPSSGSSSIPARSAGQAFGAAVRAVSPFMPSEARAAAMRRAEMGSRPEIDAAPLLDDGTGPAAYEAVVARHPSDAADDRSDSQPDAREMTPLAGAVSRPPSIDPPSERQTRPVDVNTPPESEDAGHWPTTRALLAEDLGEPPDEKTRIGVPAYAASAKLATESTEDTPAPPLNPVPVAPPDPMLRPSQAMRVVVWRAVDGVHVAPQGTRVAAISVDAVLVALDPSADLAAWLSGK